MGILTTTASAGLVGRTSAVNPFDLAEVFPGASSCLNDDDDDEPSSKGLKLGVFFFSLLALAV